MKEIILLLALIKGNSYALSDNLNQKEIDCRCDRKECHQTLIHEDVIQAFQATRDEYGYRLIVTSGFRCQDHNRDVHGSPSSFHTSGMAIDLTAENIHELHDIAKRHFDTVILYEKQNFIHCHLDRRR